MDTSRGGVYHNKKYQWLAVEVGLTVERQKSNGWLQTTLPEETDRLYRTQIDDLVGVLVAHRRIERGVIAAIGDSSDIDDAETTPDQDEPERAPATGST
ncbi:hypothetical protein ACWZHB_19245 [Nocardia sp. FBN12]|uniref:hypothetical protein n=1 Tax=Nocardia sp. FBN12 TaxID=3419766 RepID=UPI003D05055C